MKTKKPRSKVSKQALPGYLCFSLDPNGPTRQRASYSNERREEVNDIRKSGACLRCQLLKKPCSRGDPCDRCIKAAAKNSSSRCLSWMDCIRPSLQKLSIYGTDISSLNDLALGGVPVLQYFADGGVQLKFDIPFQWNIDELSTFLAGWLLADPESSTAASMVGIMSSASLYSTLSAIIGSELAQIFKILIYTTSLLYNAGGGHFGGQSESHDIKVIRYCGGRILQYLESQLRPSQLAKLTRHKLYAAFLLLLGTAIASNYFEEVLGVDFYQSITGPESVGAELVKLLSHYIVYIGQQTGLIHSSINNMTSRGLLLFETKRPRFTWESTSQFRSSLCCNTESEQAPPRVSTERVVGSVGDGSSMSAGVSSAADEGLGAPVKADVLSLDAIAIRLLETSDVDMLDDNHELLQQKYSEDSPRKDSLGCDLFVNHSVLHHWEEDKVQMDLPTVGFDSNLFEADVDRNWPCLNRIPSPVPTETDVIFEDLNWDAVGQETYPRISCGILPSCTSSPSVGFSPSGSPRPSSLLLDMCNERRAYDPRRNSPGLALGEPDLTSLGEPSSMNFELDCVDFDLDSSWPYPDRKPSCPTPERDEDVSLWCKSRFTAPHGPERCSKMSGMCCRQRIILDSFQVEQLLDVIRYQRDEIPVIFDLGFLESLERMQREEAPFDYHQLLDEIREQLEGQASQKFEEMLNQLGQKFTEGTSERRLLL